MLTLVRAEPVPVELHSGDKMSREEFHRIYSGTPEDFKAELVGGIVYVASPLKRPHGTRHLGLGGLFWMYAAQTPGVEAGDNTTILLGEEGEPQPDLYLRILPEFGGRSRTTDDDFVAGAPELLAEIAHSSRALDLHAKKDDYERFGVLEYLVVCLAEGELRWYDLASGRELSADSSGIVRIRTFPGVWIDGAAVLAGDHQRAMAVLGQGMASPEHAEFEQRLAARAPR